ncbi:MAG: phosphoadenosine phosphosulfate reductase family protein [Candidatus Babeliales bacterium]|jgi:phosphoadenosine phosphosulfate reductase
MIENILKMSKILSFNTLKLNNTKLVIKKAIDKFGDDCVVSCSFGKDSVLVLYLARQIKPDIRVMFCNTLNEFPETIQLKNRLVEEWDLNLIETRPYKDMTFRKCLDNYGLPQVRLQGKNRTPKCCMYLKEYPAINAVKEYGIKALLTGLTSAESRNRFLVGKRMEKCCMERDGMHYTSFYWFTKGWNCWKFNPIMNWTEKEVFTYHSIQNIPLNEVYTKWNGIYPRCGCLMCTAYISWKDRLSISHPALYQWLKTFEANKND